MGYRELGLLATLIMWGAFAYLLYKWRGKKSMSLSLHAASARSAYRFFAAVLLLAGALYSIFMLSWFIPQFRLPVAFGHLFLFTMLCLLFAAIIPDTKGLNRKLHRFFGYTLAFLLFVITVFIFTTCTLSIPTQIIGGATIAYMLFVMAGFAFVKRFMKHYLLFQVAYIVTFQIFILAAAYLQ